MCAGGRGPREPGLGGAPRPSPVGAEGEELREPRLKPLRVRLKPLPVRLKPLRVRLKPLPVRLKPLTARLEPLTERGGASGAAHGQSLRSRPGRQRLRAKFSLARRGGEAGPRPR